MTSYNAIRDQQVKMARHILMPYALNWLRNLLQSRKRNFDLLTRASVTDFLTQRWPSAKSVTRPVKVLNQRVSSSLPPPPNSCSFSFSCARKCNSFIAKQNTTATLATQNVFKTLFVSAKTKQKYVKGVNLITAK